MDRILIVDDEPQVLSGIRRVIGRHFEADATTSADEALRMLTAKGSYAAILSDLSMAGMDGLTFLERARELAPMIPRIMLTGYGDRAALLGAINRAGVSAFVQKPVRPNELVAVLRKAIGEAGQRNGAPLEDLTAAQRELIGELRAARFDLHFQVLLQPRIDAHRGSLAGAEALLRWTHPERGPIPPSTFIPVAEATGLIDTLTAWVLREVARAWRALAAEGIDIPVSVNVSAAANSMDRTLEAMDAALAQFGMPANRLEIEFTETHRLETVTRIRNTLAALRARGIRTALDDFGIGYSSMDTLRLLDVDLLKIDRSFTSLLESDEKHREIVRSMVNLARALRMGVVAEGVETMEQARLLFALGVDQFQGFLFAPALPGESLVQQWRAGIWRHDPQPWKGGARVQEA